MNTIWEWLSTDQDIVPRFEMMFRCVFKQYFAMGPGVAYRSGAELLLSSEWTLDRLRAAVQSSVDNEMDLIIQSSIPVPSPKGVLI